MMISQGSQSGSALTQSIILLSCILSIMLMVPIFAKIAHFSLLPDQAARYVGWQEVFGVNQSQQRDQVIEHLIHDANIPIQTQVGVIERDDREFWDNTWSLDPDRNHTLVETDGEIFSNESEDIIIRRTNTQISEANLYMSYLENIQNVSEFISGGDFLVDYNGLIRHEIRMEGDSMGILSEQLIFSAPHALLANTWTAQTPDEVRANVNSLMPWARSEIITDLLSYLGNLPFFGELELLEGSSTHVATEVQREDRLGP